MRLYVEIFPRLLDCVENFTPEVKTPVDSKFDVRIKVGDLLTQTAFKHRIKYVSWATFENNAHPAVEEM